MRRGWRRKRRHGAERGRRRRRKQGQRVSTSHLRTSALSPYHTSHPLHRSHLSHPSQEEGEELEEPDEGFTPYNATPHTAYTQRPPYALSTLCIACRRYDELTPHGLSLGYNALAALHPSLPADPGQKAIVGLFRVFDVDFNGTASTTAF